jgi:hypothetical protein
MSLELLACYLILDNDLDKPELSLEDRRRRDRRTPRIALRKYSKSSFRYLFDSGNDQALLNCCAVDHKVFRRLLAMFTPIFNSYRYDDNSGTLKKLKQTRWGGQQGRKRDMDAVGTLGLVLYWYRTRGSVARAICMAFGLTATPMYKWIKFGRRVLLFALQHHPHAKVSLPTTDEIRVYSAAISAKHPPLLPHNVWAACDGLKVPLQKSANWAIQNQFYNGWKDDTYVNSVFVFAPDGRIRICTINAPGTWHDSNMADYGVYDKMEAVYQETNARVVVDSAFKLRDVDFLRKSSQQPAIDATPSEIVLNTALTAARQCSEHGMRMISGQFPRLKDRMPLGDFQDRRVILQLMVYLYNYQTYNVGINHILNNYMSETPGFHSYNTTITNTANRLFDN